VTKTVPAGSSFALAFVRTLSTVAGGQRRRRVGQPERGAWLARTIGSVSWSAMKSRCSNCQANSFQER